MILSSVVLDASVVTKCLIVEDDSDAAIQLMTSHERLLAPDFILIEIANVFWKRTRRQQVELQDALASRHVLRELPLELIDSVDLLKSAVELAVTTERSVYDCLYLALALRQECLLWTADERFVKSLTRGPYRGLIRQLGKD